MLVLGACVACTACAEAPVKPSDLQLGDYSHVQRHGSWTVRQRIRLDDIPGISVALVDNQEIVWAQGFGWADQARKIRASAETIYRAGSLAKPLTAMAVMQLVENRRLSLDDPLSKHLPDLRMLPRFPGKHDASIRHVLTHHAGLPSDRLKGMLSMAPDPFGSLVTALADEAPSSPPGRSFAYSNVGYSLLGEIVQRLAGRPFADHMSDSVFRPLGMSGAAFSPRASTSIHAAKGYRDGHEVHEPGLRDVPAGGLNASVLDIARFLRMVFAEGAVGGTPLLKRETVAEMTRQQNLDVPLDLGLQVGFGWRINGLPGLDFDATGPVLHHAGATLLFRSMMIALPRHRLGIVVMSNDASSEDAIEEIAVGILRNALEARTGIRPPSTPPVPLARTMPPASDLESWTGWWATPFGSVHIQPDRKGLVAALGPDQLNLAPREDGRWIPSGRSASRLPPILRSLAFLLQRVGDDDVLAVRRADRDVPFGLPMPILRIPDEWKARTGRYVLANRGEDAVYPGEIDLSIGDGFLVLTGRMAGLDRGNWQFALAPVSASDAAVAGIGRGSGLLLRAVEFEGAPFLHFSGYLMRRVGD
jgi:CubicO group peptidase (beta-lactamase class C family)